MKFKYHYLTNILYQETNTWYEITETFEAKFGGLGFQLTEGWITFSIRPPKIQVFYKQMKFNNCLEAFSPQPPTKYFKKDLPKQAEIIFEFSPQDEVEKVSGHWINKGGQHD